MKTKCPACSSPMSSGAFSRKQAVSYASLLPSGVIAVRCNSCMLPLIDDGTIRRFTLTEFTELRRTIGDNWPAMVEKHERWMHEKGMWG